jgi:hypothetical protein
LTDATPSTPRKAYCVLSARSLPYARLAISSLAAHSLDSLDLKLITDDESDKQQIVEAVSQLSVPDRHRWSVHAKSEADDLAATAFAGHGALQAFRNGHPCWRKVTDPLLFAAPGEEMVILDPDLLFPNHFHFEPTPASGILLMWQPPSCLLPDETVLAAFDAGFALAHHVDIGVAHARNDLDLAWLDALIQRLGGTSLPRMMHVEAIVWAALAMRVGGGYLSPRHWHCWQNSHWKRGLKQLGVAGHQLLRADPFERIKCFHGGGAAKWWVPDVIARRGMAAPRTIVASDAPMPFEPFTRAHFHADRRLKRVARRLGYYALFKA